MEDYLEAIYQLCREEGVARVKGIAERLEVTNPSVVGAVKNLKRRKLVWQERYIYPVDGRRPKSRSDQSSP
jgi:Mn-dependent DtxR family transcriptional regulator